MHITGAERGFLLLADGSPPAARYPAVAGLRLRVARGRADGGAASGHGISAAIVRRALETGEVVSTVRSRGEAAEIETPARPRRRGHAAPPDRRVPAPALPPLRGRRDGDLPPRPRRPLRGQRRLRGALQRRRPARRRGPGPPRRARHRERPALRAGAAHDRGAAEGPEAAAAVGEARHHRPDGGGHRPRAQHPAHLHHGQPGAARAAGALPVPAGDALLDRPRGRAHPGPGPAPARLQPPGPRGDGAPRGQRRGRAEPRAVPVPDRERPRHPRQAPRRPTCPASSGSRTSSRWRSSTSW